MRERPPRSVSWTIASIPVATVPASTSRSFRADARTPLHRDPSDETFYLLAGELLFHVDGREYRASVGDTVSVTRSVAYAFFVTSDVAPPVSVARAAENDA